MSGLRYGLIGWLTRYLEGVRYPYLLGICAAVFVLDLIVPDALPFADELLLGVTTLLLARLRRERTPEGDTQRRDH